MHREAREGCGGGPPRATWRQLLAALASWARLGNDSLLIHQAPHLECRTFSFGGLGGWTGFSPMWPIVVLKGGGSLVTGGRMP